jgi:hypothetical protein
VADLLAGRSVLDAEEHRPLFVRVARMLASLHSCGFKPINDISDFVVWSPREFNTVADHSVNATMDTGKSSWGRGNTRALTEALQNRMNLRVCIDGGKRSASLGAIGFAMFQASGSAPDRSSYKLLLRGGKLLESVPSAFLAEAMAFEWALECIHSLMKGVT